MERDTYSKVTIECTDPADLLPTFESLLSHRLPLRNLHWKSPTRPLRSIDVLNVALSKFDRQEKGGNAGVRRHQIPGLRQTPYLKVYLLRCDDNETYKEVSRKQIREWIQAIAPATESKKSANNQEQHDAFEWLIVHIVLPDTPASQQPRFSKQHNLGTTDSSESVGTKSKWPGKSSATLYEKLRADFNSSSKPAVDHIAQVRLPPPAARPAVSGLAPTEIEEQWQELVELLKISILNSFSARVSQYEEDIRERNNQRSLPGWNFCTFFILKEGLARGFENVGLLDDALAGYDELAAGLEDVVSSIARHPDGDEGTLQPFSKDIKQKIRDALDVLSLDEDSLRQAKARELPNDILNSVEISLYPFMIASKNHQDLILRNAISATDFQMYIFSRQLEILRRRSANSNSASNHKTSMNKARPFDLVEGNLAELAEIGRRGVSFISTCARMIRHDLYKAWGGQEGLSGDELQTQEIIINNIVASWTWCAILQIMFLTNSPALQISGTLPAMSEASINLAQQDAIVSEPDDDKDNQQTSDNIPSESRTSQDMYVLESTTAKASASLVPNPRTSTSSDLSPSVRTGAVQLAAWRAELCLLARDVLTRLSARYAPSSYRDHYRGIRRTWSSQKSGIPTVRDSLVQNNPTQLSTNQLVAGLQPISLQTIVLSGHAFSYAFEELTKIACRHFMFAGKTKSAEKAMVDLALARYHVADYPSALKYFEAVKNFYYRGAWPILTVAVLDVYADCLKRLGHHQVYVECLLSILNVSTTKTSQYPAIEHTPKVVQRQLDELIVISNQLPEEITVPFSTLFDVASVETFIRHFDDQDGFFMFASINLRAQARIHLEEGCTLVLEATEGASPATIHMKCVDQVVLINVPQIMKFASHVTAHGRYQMTRLELVYGKLRFVLEATKRSSTSGQLVDVNDITSSLPVHVFPVFPRADAIQIIAKTAPNINLRKGRGLHFQFSSGDNFIESAIIHVKPATAGLRLRLQDVSISENSDHPFQLDYSEAAQALCLRDFEANHTLDMTMPYTNENLDTTLDVSVEIIYDTNRSTFKYFDKFIINTILPISVNVQDAFKMEQLFCRFTISPATLVPIQVSSCDIKGAQQYEVKRGMFVSEPLDIFPRQPASFTCSFRPQKQSQEAKAPDMYLHIEYQCIDEIILSALENYFVGAMQASGVRTTSRLLTRHFLQTYRSKWTEQDLEAACLLREIDIWPSEDFGWRALLSGLNPAQHTECSNWLQTWHAQNSVVRFEVATTLLREISIPVDIPTPSVVVVADLQIIEGVDTLAIGRPVAATITLSWTNMWANEKFKSEHHQVMLSFEILSPSENWILGGRRRGCFLVAVDEECTFPVLLLPQRVGNLLYPTIEVKSFLRAGSGAVDALEIACEVEYKGLAKSVLVVPDLRSMTVAIDAENGGNGSSSWLVHGEARASTTPQIG